jgi:hypothetical protein
METTVKPPHPGRFRILIQPWIVKIYRVAGMIALAVILVGLVAFLAVHLFYFFNRTWVRPVILSPEHSKVVAATSALAEARGRQFDLVAERAGAKAEQAGLDRTITADQQFEAEATAALAANPKSIENVLQRHEVEKAALERLAAIDRKTALELRVKELDARAAEQDHLVTRLAASPYIRATEERRVVGFVPYQNLSNVQVGVPLYGCDWGLIKCHKVGQVTSILDGEVQDVHPHDDSVQRGVMVEINLLDADAAEQNVLFAGSKPFWWL